jgi:nucleoside-diphosphate-sugar epimerase
MMRVLVTGSTGLVGSEICNILSYSNEVIGLSRNLVNNIGNARNTLNIDLTKSNSSTKIVNLNPEIIIHAAAQIPSDKIGDSRLLALNNQNIDDNVFNAVAKTNAWLIYISGTNVYGNTNSELKRDENSQLDYTSDYASQKISSETKITNNISNSLILRLSAPYGEFMKKNTVLNKFVNQAKNNQVIQYHGTGNRTQDFIHVADVAILIRDLIDQNNLVSGIFNIASGESITMKALAAIVKEVLMSKSVISSSGLSDPQEDFRACYSIEKAKQQLSWMPTITLSDGLLRFRSYSK